MVLFLHLLGFSLCFNTTIGTTEILDSTTNERIVAYMTDISNQFYTKEVRTGYVCAIADRE